jgi:raffinose/stachyose/melibiose transport system substrate-binding protein
VTFRWWDAGYFPFTEVIAAFNEVYPNIEIEDKQVPLTFEDQALPLALNSGKGPDIFEMMESKVPLYQPYETDLTPYAIATYGEDWKSKFLPAALSQMIINDKLVAMPGYLSGYEALWYRPDVMEKAGITEPPETYEQLVNDVAALKAAGVATPFVYGASEAAPVYNISFYTAIANQTAPGKVYEANAGTAKWTDPGLVKAMENWGKFFTDGVMQEGALAATMYFDAVCAWQTGKAAYTVNGDWNNISMTKTGLAAYLGYCNQTENVEWLPANFPVVDGAVGPPVFTQGTHAYAISTTSEVKDLAWTFLAWLASNEGGGEFYRKSLEGSPMVGGPEPDTSEIVYPRAAEAYAAQRAYIAETGFAGPSNYLIAATEAAMTNALAAVASGTKTPADAMADIQAAWDSEH